MSATDVLSRYGTAALLRFLGAVAVFVALHLLRLPFLLIARLLEVGMGRVDAYLTGTTGPVPPPDRARDRDDARFRMPAAAGA